MSRYRPAMQAWEKLPLWRRRASGVPTLSIMQTRPLKRVFQSRPRMRLTMCDVVTIWCSGPAYASTTCADLSVHFARLFDRRPQGRTFTGYRCKAIHFWAKYLRFSREGPWTVPPRQVGVQHPEPHDERPSADMSFLRK